MTCGRTKLRSNLLNNLLGNYKQLYEKWLNFGGEVVTEVLPSVADTMIFLTLNYF
jgi:hypothetical protein